MKEMDSEKVEKGLPTGISFTPFSEPGVVSTPGSNPHAKLAAIVVRNATKKYIQAPEVIQGLNMTVQQGTIYSLLGSSGCGKSTILSCLIGLTKFTSGEVWLFGKKLGSKEIGIPGRNVGYMPQDCSLHNAFTISETFTYFGELNGMSSFEILSSLDFYGGLLNLPNRSSRIGQLSGGQRRRVSFAISLQHNPKLVVLDEPTVSTDALVRERIWKHLSSLAQERNATVIITTHHIEEARHSDRVGIMCNGRLVAEDSPYALMETFGTNCLEPVVLQLIRNIQESARRKNRSTSNSNSLETNNLSSIPQPALPQMAPVKAVISARTDSFKRVRALVNKNGTVAVRSLTMLLMTIIVPAFGMFSILIGNGNDPHHINFGVVNQELSTSSASCHDLKGAWEGVCNESYFSCRYLKQLSSPVFDLVVFQSTQEAEEAVLRGEIWGYLNFPQDFSWKFYERAVSGSMADPDTFHKSDMVARLDQSNAIISHSILTNLYRAYESFLRQLLSDSGYNPKLGDSPLSYSDPPIMGENVDSFQDFLLPSCFIGMLFFWSIVTSGIRYVSEKRDGTLERSLVAGVHMWEIFLSYSVTEFFIALLRILIVYGTSVWIFQMHIVGSLGLMFLLGLIASYMGVAAGFLFGSFCTEEIQVALLALAIFLPNTLVSGIFWPLEGMPVILQKISYVLPCTLACEAMRSIMSRGWEFTHPNVWPGFAAGFAYMMLYSGLAILVASMRFIK